MNWEWHNPNQNKPSSVLTARMGELMTISHILSEVGDTKRRKNASEKAWKKRRKKPEPTEPKHKRYNYQV